MYTSLYSHHFTPFYSPFGPTLMATLVPIILAVALWTVILKGFALWFSARGGQKWWFVALLIINTLGILELVYLIWFRPDIEKNSHHHHTSEHHS